MSDFWLCCTSIILFDRWFGVWWWLYKSCLLRDLHTMTTPWEDNDSEFPVCSAHQSYPPPFSLEPLKISEVPGIVSAVWNNPQIPFHSYINAHSMNKWNIQSSPCSLVKSRMNWFQLARCRVGCSLHSYANGLSMSINCTIQSLQWENELQRHLSNSATYLASEKKYFEVIACRKKLINQQVFKKGSTWPYSIKRTCWARMFWYLLLTKMSLK